MTSFFKIVVTHIVDPLNFWAHIGDDKTHWQFENFEKLLGDHVEKLGTLTNTQPESSTLDEKRRSLILVRTEIEGKIFRGLITSINWEDDEIDVMYVDYGSTQYVQRSSIILDVPEFAQQWPYQAWRCGLAGIRPIANKFVSRAITMFEELVLKKKLDVSIIDVSENRVPTVDITYSDAGDGPKRSITDILLHEGCGMSVGDGTFEQFIAPSSSEKEASTERDFEKEAFLRNVPVSQDGTFEEFECSDMKIGTPEYPSRNMFAIIQEQIDHCRKIHSAFMEGRSSDDSDEKHFKRAPNKSHTSKPRRAGARGPRAGYRGESSSPSPGALRKNRHMHESKGRGLRNKNTDANTVPGKSYQMPKPREHPSGKEATASEALPASSVPVHSAYDSFGLHKSRASMSNDSSETQIENEKEWNKDQMKYKVRMILDAATHEKLEETTSLLKLLIETEKCRDESPHIDSKLYLLLHNLIEYIMWGGDKKSDIILLALETLHDQPHFPDSIIRCLWTAHDNYITVKAHPRSVGKCDAFCNLIGRLYVTSDMWDENCYLTVFMIDVLENWTKWKDEYSVDLLSLYANCLTAVLRVVGPSLVDMVPSEMDKIFAEVKMLILSSTFPKMPRELLMDLLILVESNFQTCDRSKTLSSLQKSSQPPKMYTDSTCQTDSTTYADIGIKLPEKYVTFTKEDPMVAPNNLSSVLSKDTDPYMFVRTMLSDLQLDAMQPTFTNNAIRDSVLDCGMGDIKDLLKECGVLPGQILEIKSYISNHRERSVCSSHSCNNSGRSTSSRDASSRVRLISPQQYESSCTVDLCPRVLPSAAELAKTGEEMPASQLTSAAKLLASVHPHASSYATSLGSSTDRQCADTDVTGYAEGDAHNHHSKTSDFLITSFKQINADLQHIMPPPSSRLGQSPSTMPVPDSSNPTEASGDGSSHNNMQGMKSLLPQLKTSTSGRDAALEAFERANLWSSGSVVHAACIGEAGPPP